MAMTKPTAGRALFELIFAALLIVIGVLRPKILWNSSAVYSFRSGWMTDTMLSIILIALGAALGAWCLFRLFVFRKA
jgi:hypothetical protein